MRFSAALLKAPLPQPAFPAQAAAEGLTIGSDADIKFTAKTLTYYKTSNGPGQILGMRPGPPPSGYYDYHLVDLLRRPSSTTGIPPAPPRTKTTSSCAALPLPDR
ncbi:hypothetical protein CRV24_004765 [Beauveria bassiana]|nr:hypothetical protein CRV24_004765 [Beauveria bassiana]KAH8711400.1 hypothetical protein HC256_008213 [Beauveria bassiana]